MKKETIKYIIQLIVAVLTAIGSTLSVTTAASGAPAEGVALLGGTIVGTGWLHHLSTRVEGPPPTPPKGGEPRREKFSNSQILDKKW